MARKRTKRKRKPPGTWVATQNALAKAVGKSLNQIAIYRREHGAPIKPTQWGYHVDPLLAWMRENGYTPGQHSQKVKVPEGSTKDRLLRAQADEREAKAELAQLKLKVERGDFVPREDMKKRDVARIQVVKRGLLALAKQLPPRLTGLRTQEMEVVIKQAVRDLLTRFSQM